jgi:hypothetical protein
LFSESQSEFRTPARFTESFPATKLAEDERKAAAQLLNSESDRGSCRYEGESVHWREPSDVARWRCLARHFTIGSHRRLFDLPRQKPIRGPHISFLMPSSVLTCYQCDGPSRPLNRTKKCKPECRHISRLPSVCNDGCNQSAQTN